MGSVFQEVAKKVGMNGHITFKDLQYFMGVVKNAIFIEDDSLEVPMTEDAQHFAEFLNKNQSQKECFFSFINGDTLSVNQEMRMVLKAYLDSLCTEDADV